MKEPVDHILRPLLPWRSSEGAITECGYDASKVKALTRPQYFERLKDLGVTWHGAVGQPELHEAFAQTNVWTMPEEFNEISSITAMKAQALGAVPVCSRYAALDETVQFGDKIGKVDVPDIREHKAEFIESVVMRICAPDESERCRMMLWANQTYPWTEVAADWIRHLKGWITDGRENATRTLDDADASDRPGVRSRDAASVAVPS